MSENSNSQPLNSSNGFHRKDSETFHKEFGDFALESNDGVVFHVSRFLLVYTSPVFKDMFNLGPNSNTSTITSGTQTTGSPSNPLQLTEDAETLDLLFRIIDPNLPNQPIGTETIQKLLEAARKYQTTAVMTWFETEVTKRLMVTGSVTHDQSMLSKDPMFVLSLAAEYNLPNLCREAVRQRVNDGPIRQTEANIPSELLRRIFILKQERVQKYLSAITDIIDAVLLARNQLASSLRCDRCSRSFGDWIGEILSAVQDRPVWEEFNRAFYSLDWPCDDLQECNTWASEGESDADKFMEVMKEEESKLPDLE